MPTASIQFPTLHPSDNYHVAQMVANTSLSLQEATAFYEDSMKKQGWLPREMGRRIDKEIVYLPYYWGQRDVTIALVPIADGLVRIRAGKYSDSSWQQSDLQSASDSTANAQPSLEDSIEAAELPILHATGAPTYDQAEGEIRFELEKIPLKELSQEYSDSMKALGWSVKAFGEPTDNSVGLHFEKGSKIVYYSSSIDPLATGSVRFSGYGLTWTKPIASGQLVSYSGWLRNNKFPATLKRMDEYQTEMEKLQTSTKSQ